MDQDAIQLNSVSKLEHSNLKRSGHIGISTIDNNKRQ